MRGRLLLVIMLVTSAAGSVSAQTAKPAGSPGPTTAGIDVKNGQALINGTAVDSSAAPVPNATVRLRNLASKQIEQVATANELGEFSFVVRPDVPYVVEIADRVGRVLAVGDVVMAQAGDVAAAVVSIPGRLPAAAGLFGNTLGSVLSAAAGTGVTTAPDPPLSPEK